MHRKVWVLLIALLGGAFAQRGPTTEAMAQGLKWILESCQLQAQVLTCTVNVENMSKSLANIQIPGGTVVAVTSSGWLYQGQALPNPIKLSPGQKTKVTVRFSGLSQNTDSFAVIRLGEAWFTGITIPSQKLTVTDSKCRFSRIQYDYELTCTLVVRNENPVDVTLTILGSDSFVALDSGATFKGAWGVREGAQRFVVVVPGQAEVGVSVYFQASYGSFQKDGYFPQKARVVRFRTVGGWIEAKDVPFLYCGENYGPCQNP